MKTFDFHMPTRIVFGEGRIAELESLLPPGRESVLVVTDPGVARHSGALGALVRHLGGRSHEVFDAVEENPTYATATAGAARAREIGAGLVIGLGGGSPMDAAKGIAVLARNPGEITAYMRGEPLERDPLPVVCVPTTSGTGSEVTPYAVFTDRDAMAKGALSHPLLFPQLALVDPELTHSMPPPLVVATGLDALTHAVEAYLSTESFPLNDCLALEALETVLGNLPAAAARQREAMAVMAYASMLAGVAIAHASTILPHVMGYPLTVFHDVPHGVAGAVLLPGFLAFLEDHSTAPVKVERLRGLLEPHGGAAGFLEGLGVATSLASHGVREEEIDAFVARVIVKGDVEITPAPITEETIADIYRASM